MIFFYWTETTISLLPALKKTRIHVEIEYGNICVTYGIDWQFEYKKSKVKNLRMGA